MINRPKRSGAALAGALLSSLLLAASAHALTGTIEVQASGPGRVTGEGIDCPGDCLQGYSAPGSSVPAARRLTAVPSAGHTVTRWQNCAPVAGNPLQCDATPSEAGIPVEVTFADTTPPSPSIDAPALGAVVRTGSIPFSASATDGNAVARVELLVDGTVRATRTAPPYATDVDVDALSEGTHTFAVAAYDPAGNVGRTSRDVGVDRTAPTLFVPNTVVFTNATFHDLTFTAGADAVSTVCRASPPGSSVPTVTDDCTSGVPHRFTVATEGWWKLTVTVRDAVGNHASSSATSWWTAPRPWCASPAASDRVASRLRARCTGGST